MDVLVATSLAFETDGSILSAGPEAALLPLAAPDPDAFFIMAAGWRATVPFAALPTALLAAGVVCAADCVDVLAVLPALALVAAGGFALTVPVAGFGDFTPLLAGAFFAGTADCSVLTALPAGDFAARLAGVLTAVLARVPVADFGAVFFALFAVFVTVAFIVPCP